MLLLNGEVSITHTPETTVKWMVNARDCSSQDGPGPRKSYVTEANATDGHAS